MGQGRDLQQEITDGTEAQGQKAPLSLLAPGDMSPEPQGSSPAIPLWGPPPHLASKIAQAPQKPMG